MTRQPHLNFSWQKQGRQLRVRPALYYVTTDTDTSARMTQRSGRGTKLSKFGQYCRKSSGGGNQFPCGRMVYSLITPCLANPAPLNQPWIVGCPNLLAITGLDPEQHPGSLCHFIFLNWIGWGCGWVWLDLQQQIEWGKIPFVSESVRSWLCRTEENAQHHLQTLTGFGDERLTKQIPPHWDLSNLQHVCTSALHYWAPLWVTYCITLSLIAVLIAIGFNKYYDCMQDWYMAQVQEYPTL